MAERQQRVVGTETGDTEEVGARESDTVAEGASVRVTRYTSNAPVYFQIAALSPAASNYAETLSTLRYADRYG